LRGLESVNWHRARVRFMAGQGCMAFQRGNTILQRVEELIDPISEQWDEQLLAQTFWDDDASLIKADVVGWHYDSKGCFSVRSAYKVHRTRDLPISITENGNTTFLRSVQTAKICSGGSEQAYKPCTILRNKSGTDTSYEIQYYDI